MNNTLIKIARRFQYKLFVYAQAARSLIALKNKYPELKDKLNYFENKNKYINWLISRFGEKPVKKEMHPITDCLPILQRYDGLETSVVNKYKNKPEFKEKIDAIINPKKSSNPSDINNLSSDDLVSIMNVNDQDVEGKQRFTWNVEDVRSKIEADRVGKVGPWNIWLPSTRENSVEIAGYTVDEKTKEKIPKTDWCTARIGKSNLFYNYIHVMLFYIIKDNPSGREDWLSLGYEDGEFILNGEDGRESVDRDNYGLYPERLEEILGPFFDKILNLIINTTIDHGEISPALKKLREASTNLSEYKNMMQGLDSDSKDELITKMIDDNENLPDDIMLECIKDFSGNIGDFKNSEHLRRNIILNFSPSLQAKIIALPDHNKKRFILLSKNVDTEVLLHLLKTGNDGDKFEVINWLAYGTGSNHDWSNNSQQEIINYFLNNSDPKIKARFLKNTIKFTTPESLKKIIDDKSEENAEVRASVLDQKNLTEEMRNELLNDSSVDVVNKALKSYHHFSTQALQTTIVKHLNHIDRINSNLMYQKFLTPELFEMIFDHSNDQFKMSLCENFRYWVKGDHEFIANIIKKLFSDDNLSVKRNAVHYLTGRLFDYFSTPEAENIFDNEILEKYKTNQDNGILNSVINNHRYLSPRLLRKIGQITNEDLVATLVYRYSGDDKYFSNIINGLSVNSNPDVRIEMFRHIGSVKLLNFVTEEAKRNLLNDPDERVRKLAKELFE